MAFALGIGVTTAVFSIFNRVLLAPLLFVSVAACYLPARWAGRVDPAMVLRND